MIYLTLFFVVTFLVLLLENFYRRRPFEKYISKKLPSLPIIYSTHLFFFDNLLNVLVKYSKKFKEPFYFRAGFTDYYYTQNPEEIKEILTNPKTIGKGYIYAFLQWILPDTLIIAHEVIWKKKRRCLSKAFTQRKLNSLVPFFDTNVKDLVEKLGTEKFESPMELIERNAVDNFLDTMVGLDVEKMNEEISKLYSELNVYEMSKMVLNSIIKRYIKPWLYFDFIYFRTEEGKKLTSKRASFVKLLKYLVEERKKYIESRGNVYLDEVEKNLIDYMVESNLEENDILTEIMFFLGSASKTTGVVLTITCTLLGMHPHIQEKVHKEVIDVLGDGDSLDHNDLIKLKYTEMVLNETMRLFPPGPFLARVSQSDITLGDKIIPAKTNLVIAILDVHRSEKYWKDPLKFEPDRFLPEEARKRPPFTYLPFSGGPRNCIGGKFSMMHMVTILVNVLKQFELSSDTRSVEDIKIEFHGTLRVRQGLHCKLTPRTKILTMKKD